MCLYSQFGGLHWLEAMFYNGQRSQKEAERGQDNILLSDVSLPYCPFTAPACKTSGLKMVHTLLQTVYFPVL